MTKIFFYLIFIGVFSCICVISNTGVSWGSGQWCNSDKNLTKPIFSTLESIYKRKTPRAATREQNVASKCGTTLMPLSSILFCYCTTKTNFEQFKKLTNVKSYRVKKKKISKQRLFSSEIVYGVKVIHLLHYLFVLSYEYSAGIKSQFSIFILYYYFLLFRLLSL